MNQFNFYGFVYFLAAIVVFLVIKIFLKGENKGKEYIISTYILLGAIIGARIFYILFYNLNYFINNPLKIFYLWEGGLSSHGGIFGIILAGYFASKKYNLSFLKLADEITIPFAFFLGIGKIANLVNLESYGKITESSFCIRIDNYCRYPVQIYEAIKNGILFLVAIYLKKKEIKDGLVTVSFLFLYSSLRLLIDIFREYETNILGIGMGQYLNTITMIISGYFLVKLIRKS